MYLQHIIDRLPIHPAYKLLFMLVFVFFVVSVATIISKIMISKHTYTCTECGYKFKVKWYWGASLGPHGNNERYLKCPKCKKCTWCIIDKEN